MGRRAELLHPSPTPSHGPGGTSPGEEEGGACVDGALLQARPWSKHLPHQSGSGSLGVCTGACIWVQPLQLRSGQVGKRGAGSVTSALLYQCPWA